MNFDQWYESQGRDVFNALLNNSHGVGDLMRDAAKIAWNHALEEACEEFGVQEGTDYGVWEKMHSK